MPQNEPETPPRGCLRVYDKDFNLVYEADEPDDIFGLTVVVDSRERGRLTGRVESVIWKSSLIHTGL